MRRGLITILLLVITITSNAQSIGLGLRDNQFARVDYEGAFRKSQVHHWQVGLEQSMLNVKPKNQSGKLYAGYLYDKNALRIECDAYFGSEYSRVWNVYGAYLSGEYQYKILSLGATINPNKDSKLGQQLNYDIELGASLWKNDALDSHMKQSVDVYASYGNIPEYRDNVKNARIGLKFTSGNLWVRPEVSIPGIDKRSSEYMRVLCSLGWKFEFGKD